MESLVFLHQVNGSFKYEDLVVYLCEVHIDKYFVAIMVYFFTYYSIT